MCSQYTLKTNSILLAAKYGVETNQDVEIQTRILPYKQAIVIRQQQQKLIFDHMNYSLVPAWSETPKVKFATHNARIETILEKPTWKKPFLSQRCLVPMSTFIESIYDNSWAGNLVHFYPKDGSLLTAAGVYDTWLDPETKKTTQSFAILTEQPPPFILEAGHDRCPIFLNDNAFKDWLNPNEKDPAVLLQILKEAKPNYEYEVSIDRPLKPGWEKRK